MFHGNVKSFSVPLIYGFLNTSGFFGKNNRRADFNEENITV
jgi:hypothetical protein